MKQTKKETDTENSWGMKCPECEKLSTFTALSALEEGDLIVNKDGEIDIQWFGILESSETTCDKCGESVDRDDIKVLGLYDEQQKENNK